jgi:hypothetical protein
MTLISGCHHGESPRGQPWGRWTGGLSMRGGNLQAWEAGFKLVGKPVRLTNL